MKKSLLVFATALVALAPMSASAAILRGGFVGGGPGFYGGWYNPYRGVARYYGYPNSGEVKLDTKVKDAQVFINGSFAGTTHENKTMRLGPGNYNIAIREGAQTPSPNKSMS